MKTNLEKLQGLEKFFALANKQREEAIKFREEMKTFLEDESFKADKELYDSMLQVEADNNAIIERRSFGNYRIDGMYDGNNMASVTVTSKLFPEKSITAEYTKEAADDLMDFHGIDIRVELEKILKTQIEIEEAREIKISS